VKNDSAQKKIIEAAIACIEREGLHNVTIRGIGREAGVNSAAISYYFRSKEKLIAEALRATLVNAFGDWEVLLERGGIDLRDRLRSVFREVLEGSLRFPGIVKAHLQETFLSGASRTLFIGRLNSFLASISREMRKSLPATSAQETGRIVVQMFSSVLLPGIMPQLFGKGAGIDLSSPRMRGAYVDSVIECFLGNRPRKPQPPKGLPRQ
jgi:AcrR family transcriptional regulator